MEKPTAVEWPQVTIGGLKYTLRLSYAANYQMARWGKNLASATTIELAAAMMGNFDPDGKWRSAGFERAVDLADMMESSDELPVIAAVTEAIKKAYPELEITAQQTPVTQAPTSEATKTDSSISGPFPSVLPV
jgi:hypothetical protein